MSQKSVSMIKKQRLIREQLRNFPVLGSRLSISSASTPNKQDIRVTKNLPNKKSGLQKGKSLEIERAQIFNTTINNFKRSMENGKPKNQVSRLIKKKRNRTLKQESFSRTSLMSSDNMISLPSTATLNHQYQILKLSEQNKKFRKIIQNQKNHIKSLELILSNL